MPTLQPISATVARCCQVPHGDALYCALNVSDVMYADTEPCACFCHSDSGEPGAAPTWSDLVTLWGCRCVDSDANKCAQGQIKAMLRGSGMSKPREEAAMLFVSGDMEVKCPCGCHSGLTPAEGKGTNDASQKAPNAHR